MVTDVGDLETIGDTDFVVPTNDPEALANAIIEFPIKPEAFRENLGKLVRERIEKNFPIKSIICEYE
jgi:glycosyltransferase involved in cell wall biosynthesis